METMYPGMVNSPATTLSEAFTADDDHIHVTELAVFPAAPNIAVIGSGTDACTYAYTGKSAASGSGTLTGVSDIEGTDKNWASGEVIARNFTNFDLVTVQDNLEELGDDISSLVTTATKTIYVDKAATGAGTGVDWTNAFTTIQAAIDSIPTIVAHDQTIIVKKGSTDYAEDLYFSRIAGGGFVTLRGQYYYRSTNNSSKTGKLDIKSDAVGYDDRAQIAAGDVVWAMKYTGTVGESAPSDSIRDTVASVDGTEITLTTNTAKAFDTSWMFCIVKTKLTDNGGDTLKINSYCGLNVVGLSIEGTDEDYSAVQCVPNINGLFSNCFIKATDCEVVVYATASPNSGNMEYCYVYSATIDNICFVAAGSASSFTCCVFECTADSWSVGIDGFSMASLALFYCRFAAGDIGLNLATNACAFVLYCDNDATVPWDPAESSDGAYMWVIT